MLYLKSWPLRQRLMVAWWSVYYEFRHGPVSHAINALWALGLAWKFLRGKVIIIDSQPAVANGGYKYLTITFSKRPLSCKHTYEDL